MLALLLAGISPSCEKYVLPSLEVSPDTLFFSAKADSLRLHVETNVITSVVVEDAEIWISASPDWFEESCDVVVRVEENEQNSQRKGSLPIKSEAIKRTVVIVQEGKL